MFASMLGFSFSCYKFDIADETISISIHLMKNVINVSFQFIIRIRLVCFLFAIMLCRNFNNFVEIIPIHPIWYLINKLRIFFCFIQIFFINIQRRFHIIFTQNPSRVWAEESLIFSEILKLFCSIFFLVLSMCVMRIRNFFFFQQPKDNLIFFLVLDEKSVHEFCLYRSFILFS